MRSRGDGTRLPPWLRGTTSARVTFHRHRAVNIGAGTITCNYDGANKHKTRLGNGVFIGSNATLVAPLQVEDGGFVGAGSTITKVVKGDQLAISRAPQRNIDGWKRPVKKPSGGES